MECTGCGFCCAKVPCYYGAVTYGTDAPCGGLVWRDSRHWCRLVLERGSRTARALDIGKGCCSGLNSWRREPFQDRTRKEVP